MMFGGLALNDILYMYGNFQAVTLLKVVPVRF